MTALELSQLAANYATVLNMGAAVATLAVAALTYLELGIKKSLNEKYPKVMP